MATLKVASLELAFISLLVFICATKQNCSEAQCKVLPVEGENLTLEFQSKISEKHAMVYLNLEIGHQSYNLDLKDVFIPDVWVWADSIEEPMLQLPFEFNILSLGLLNYQVRRMTVPLEDHPSGYLASLNSSCHNLAVGRALLHNVTKGSFSKAEVVCVQMIEKDDDSGVNSVQYLCCSSNTSAIRCDLPVERSKWLNAIQTVLEVISLFLSFYSPMLLLVFPDCIFSLRNECDKEDNRVTNTANVDTESIADNTRDEYERITGENKEQDTEDSEAEESEESVELAVDDASPITCSNLLVAYVQRLPELRMSFTIKLAFLLFGIVPFFDYVKLGLYLALKYDYLKKLPPDTILGLASFTPFFANMESFSSFFPLSVWVLFSLFTVLFLRPKDLILSQHDQLLSEIYCSMTKTTRIILPEALLHVHSIGDVIIFNFKVLQPALFSYFVSLYLRLHKRGLKNLFYLATCSLPDKMNHGLSRKWLAFRILWVLLSIFPVLFVGLVFEAICLLLTFVAVAISLIILSPLFTLFRVFFNIYMVVYLPKTRGNKIAVCLSAVVFGLFAFSFYFFYQMISSSCLFIIQILGFTSMGLVLNARFLAPYVAFFIVLTTNIWLCYVNLQNRYKEVKRFILQYQLRNVSQTDSGDQSTIPTKLFWFVCDRVFPVEMEVCLMLCKMTAIVVFLFLALLSMVFLRDKYKIANVVSTIYVFVSGLIPGLFLDGLTKGKNLVNGWRKVKLERAIKTAVGEFYSESGGDTNTTESEEEGASNRNNVSQV